MRTSASAAKQEAMTPATHERLRRRARSPPPPPPPRKSASAAMQEAPASRSPGGSTSGRLWRRASARVPANGWFRLAPRATSSISPSPPGQRLAGGEATLSALGCGCGCSDSPTEDTQRPWTHGVAANEQKQAAPSQHNEKIPSASEGELTEAATASNPAIRNTHFTGLSLNAPHPPATQQWNDGASSNVRWRLGTGTVPRESERGTNT